MLSRLKNKHRKHKREKLKVMFSYPLTLFSKLNLSSIILMYLKIRRVERKGQFLDRKLKATVFDFS